MMVDLTFVKNLLLDLKLLGRPKFFSIIFEYKDSKKNRELGRVGKSREMVCSFNIDKFSKGGKGLDPDISNVFTVCDLSLIKKLENPYRSFSVSSIKRVKVDSKEYIVNQGE